MSDHHIQLGLLVAQIASLIIQVAGFVALVVYAFDTRKMRNAAEEQIKISRGLSKAAMDQVEGLSKPCITIWGDLRNGSDVILEMHGATGNVIAGQYQGSYVFQNVGNGVAINIRYRFTRPNVQSDRNWRYIPALLPDGRIQLIETVSSYNTEHSVTIAYDSNGGRRYRTEIELNHRVITSFKFVEVTA